VSSVQRPQCTDPRAATANNRNSLSTDKIC
jgi:hypothetical protein